MQNETLEVFSSSFRDERESTTKKNDVVVVLFVVSC